LEEKRSNKPGCFILRQCEQIYDVYYIDVCNKHRYILLYYLLAIYYRTVFINSLNFSLKPMTYKIEKNKNGFIFDNKETPVYQNIGEIINTYKNPEDDIYLQDCLPPSDYGNSLLIYVIFLDKSQVLLCQSNEPTFTSNIRHDDLDDLLGGGFKGPQCISANDLQLYRGTYEYFFYICTLIM